MQSDTPPDPPADAAPAPQQGQLPDAGALIETRADGTVVIDLTRLLPPPPPGECIDEAPDPLNPEILVCRETAPAQRLGPVIGPADDGFASAIPRARIKLSDTAAAEANATNPSVGGWNAQGGEVRLKIDF